MRSVFLVLFVTVLSVFSTFGQQLAFPEAVGFGRYVTGGRNGTVYRVTNLNDSGPGSLRDAVSQPNRIVIFDVGGVIKITNRIVFSSNLTVAGQTAPGEGIVVYGNGVTFSGAHNVIVRHMTFRMGIGGTSGADAMGIANGSNMIFDHVSASWGRDEVFSINWDNKGSEPNNITIQNSIIAQGLAGHSAGGLMQTDGGVTLYRNLYIDNHTRNPKVKGLNQFVNNVVYNWGGGGCYILGDSQGTSWATIENNYFINGPSGGSSPYSRANSNFQLFAQGNYQDGNRNGVLDGRLSLQADYGPVLWVESPDYWANVPDSDPKKIPQMHPEIPGMMTAEESYYWIVDNVGRSLPVRDEVDKFLISELTSLGTVGAIISSENELPTAGPGNVFGGPLLEDTDGDGIPDIWEDILGTDKNVNDAMEIGPDGYTNLERYINSITGPMPYLKYPLQVRATGLTTTSITLSWTNPEENAEQLVVEKRKSGEEFTEAIRIAGDATSVTLPDLESGTTYFIRIKAVKDELKSLYSSVLSISTQTPSSPPSPSTDPVPADGVSGVSYNTLALSWENPTGIMGGIVYYSVFLGTTPESMDLVSDKQTGKSWNAPSLDQGTTYYWRVKAENLLGEDEGTVWSFTTGEPVERNKVFHMPFDETSGTTAVELISDVDAVAHNFTPQWQLGQLENSIYFPGTPVNSHLKFPHNPGLFLNNQSFSISLWFRSPGNIADSYLLHKGTHANANGGTGKWIGIQYKGTTLTFGIDDDITKTDLNITGANQWFNNQWQHLVCIRDRETNQLRVFINGVQVGQRNDATLQGIGETGDLIIGNRNVNFDNPYPGNLDDIRIYDSVLTPDEVVDLYNKTTTSIRNIEDLKVDVKAYPNPFDTEVNLVVEDVLNAGTVNVRIFDLSGRLVFETRKESFTGGAIHIGGLANLPKGIYTCVINTVSGDQVLKLIKK